jgi:hypothetical protein
MSTEESEQEAAPPTRSKSKQTETKADVQIPDMPVSQLVEGATAYLGCPSWTAAGALRGHEPDEMMSVDTAKAEIEKWRQTPLDNGEE